MRASGALEQQQNLHLQPNVLPEQRDVVFRASKIFYLSAAIFATSVAAGSYVAASQGLVAMGGVFLGAQFIGRLIGRVSNYHTDPNIASAAKVESFMGRHFWASLILMSAYLGLCGAAACFGIALLKSATLMNAPMLFQSAGCGIGSFVFFKRAHIHGSNALDATSAKQYQGALFPIYAILNMASRADEKNFANLRQRASDVIAWTKIGPDGRRRLEDRLSSLQKSLAIAKANGEEIPAKLVNALLTIYLLNGDASKQLELAAKILDKNSDLAAPDLCKHCLPLVHNYDHMIQKFSLDTQTLCTYLSDTQFESYFQTKKLDSILNQTRQWKQQVSEGNWGQLEKEMVLDGSVIQRTFESFIERARLTHGGSKTARMERLEQYRSQIDTHLDLIETTYPRSDSCLELCHTLTDEQFRNFFLLDGSLTIVEEIIRDRNEGFSKTLAKLNLDVSENDIAGALDDILLRLIARTQTLPEVNQAVESSDENGRLITLYEQQRKARGLREELLKKFPILTDFDFLIAKCAHSDTQGFIPPLDLEIHRRTALRLTILPDEVEKDREKLRILQSLQDKAMSRIGQIIRAEQLRPFFAT